MATFDSKKDVYEIGEVVAENARYRIRQCRNSSGRELLFQVAIDAAQNQYLSRNAWFLTKLRKRSDDIDAKQIATGNRPYNYRLGFPELIEDIIVESQGSRQLNILGFVGIDKLSKVIPLVKLWKDSLRVDLRSSAWMMGKLLKIISFAHDNRIAVGDLSGNNVLIDPDQHYIIVFDWSQATIHEGNVPAKSIREEIKLAAQLIIKALGDDLECARTNDLDLSYTNYLQYLATNGESDAVKAHKNFYNVVDSLCENPDSTWELGFYNFVTLSRGSDHGT